MKFVSRALASLCLVSLVANGSSAQEEAKVNFAEQIKPILESSCLKCHNGESPKGDFRLDSKEAILAGGGSGEPGITVGKADESLLLELITLDADDPNRMPAEGENLTEEQIELIRKWINEGADWPEGVALQLPEQEVSDDVLDQPGVEISDAEKAAVAKLEELGFLALRIAQNTNWLYVNLSLGFDTEVADEQLALLKDCTNLVELNLRGTKITDSGLAHLQGLTNMVNLHLELTAVTGAGLAALSEMTNLRYLNLYGTQVTDEGLAHLHGLKNLQKVYLWQAPVSDEAVQQLQEALPELSINRGIVEKPIEAVAAVAQVDTITLTAGGTTDTWNVTVDGNTLAAAVAFNTDLKTTAADLVTAINADATISALVTAAAGTNAGEVTLTAKTAGTGFTATSTATDVTVDDDVAASTDATTTANVVEVVADTEEKKDEEKKDEDKKDEEKKDEDKEQA